MNTTIEKKERKEKPKKSLTMLCECCGNKFDRWLIDIVEPEDIVFEINQILKERGEEVPHNFACPECVTELALIPLQTQEAKTFRERNEKIRLSLAPSIIH